MNDDGNLLSGASLESFVAAIAPLSPDAIGMNCSVGPKTMLDVIEEMVPVSSKPLIAMPNAGMPKRVEGRNIYLCSPEYMAQYARRMLLAGVRIVGGCCGTTPEHIAAIARGVSAYRPRHRGDRLLSPLIGS